jgi:hypothetical protein
MVDNRKAQGISETLAHRQPGMLMTEPVTGAQLASPGRAVHIFVELVIQVPLHALLFQPADRATWLTTGFH